MALRFLQGTIFGVIWLVGTAFLVELATQHGSLRFLGLSRSQLLILSQVAAGVLWAVYYVHFLHRRRDPSA